MIWIKSIHWGSRNRRVILLPADLTNYLLHLQVIFIEQVSHNIVIIILNVYWVDLVL